MKVKNLADYPQQLGDNRVIGAAGTKEDTREYDLEALAEEKPNRAAGLTKEDKHRVKNGTLVVIEEVEQKVEPKVEPKVEEVETKSVEKEILRPPVINSKGDKK